ncbi:branched-chain amino acid ABC transporter permease [Methyloligella sp. 2.7D]|uniref:branched-chain amino acid ABC transporter permease n=1 Tax=unclassified Methyloligella TaxID=2625955 RepID=UPI00157D56AE|nr:branched-chain amino acid ABC transporter permease [Methyloligella sp. GL2]QKP78238.1 branched-chain amino acid ABC transporter permease [Methyloligella sp. GL2]
MSETNEVKWRNPLAVWPGGKEIEELPTNAWHSHQDVWRARRESKTKLYPVGRLRYWYKFAGHGGRLWSRMRYWPTRRRVLDVRGEYNRKTLQREKTVADRRPIYWLLCLAALAIAPLLAPSNMQYTLLVAGATFGIYAAINLCWNLVIGIGGIFSLATYSIVGTSAFITAYLSIQYGFSWWMLAPIGAVVGLLFGAVIAFPATRLDGFYYALLTLGLNELCRVYFTTSSEFGGSNGGLYGADSYIPDSWSSDHQLLLGYYACFGLMLAALFLHRFVGGRRIGRLLRMAPEKREAFAEATGVDFRRARVWIFLIYAAALGFIGGFYVTNFGGVSFSIFSFDAVLLGLAMLVIGGIGRPEGAVAGTLIVVFLDKVMLGLGPLRLVLVGLIALLVVLYLRNGLFGIKTQFRAWRDKKKSEHRSTRAEKGGEMLPEEATETDDKGIVYARRFDKMTRDHLKTLVSPEIIEEHRVTLNGQHSDALERLLIYFRTREQVEKYGILNVVPFKNYRIVAFSGHKGVPPRLVEDRIYPSYDAACHGVFLRRVQDLLES